MNGRHFVLFEILIAFALVSVSIFPFLRYPFEDMRREVNLLYEMELEKLAQSELIDLQIQLYRNEINPNLIFGEKKTSALTSLEKVKVQPCAGWSKEYLKSVLIKNKTQKITNDKTKTVLLHLEVRFYELKNEHEAILKASSAIVAQKKGCK